MATGLPTLQITLVELSYSIQNEKMGSDQNHFVLSYFRNETYLVDYLDNFSDNE